MLYLSSMSLDVVNYNFKILLLIAVTQYIPNEFLNGGLDISVQFRNNSSHETTK